ncbi:hypothetical protein [Pseudomonas sp. McL0111]|uniref:hypothetical protein n=1 Tax=Pseudomonas sp. McL0111 TaxID=3457357 RepID=UPI00403EA822
MNYEFSTQQRRVLDRYSRWLYTLVPIYNSTSLIFDARGQMGHRRAELSWDTRLNRVGFYEQYLQGHWARVEQIRELVNRHVNELEIFGRESLEITQRTSRSEPVNKIDVRSYRLYHSMNWGPFPPTSARSLVHELGNRFWSLNGVITSLGGIIDTLGEASFGLNAAFIKIMGWQSCACHTQPTVAQELFRKTITVPIWDLAYSSSDPSIRVKEYQADIAKLFTDFVLLNTQMGVFVREISLRISTLNTDLTQTANMATMGMLNFKIESAQADAKQLLQMLNHFEAWLRK